MGKVSVSQRIAADADAVWDVIGDFGGLADWAAGVRRCACDGQDVGAVREVEKADGARRRERLESLDEVGRSYSYSNVEVGPGEGQIATLKVWANRDGSAEVVWSTEFESADGYPGVEVFYRDSLGALSQRFG